MSTFYRYDINVRTAVGEAVSGVSVYVCTQPANTNIIPPSPLATIYVDSNGDALTNPAVTDGNGNAFFYAATGIYTIVLFDPLGRIATLVFPDQEVVSQGGGSVTSVALAMPAEFSVSGSPVTSSGTLTVSKANQNANTVAAGPSSGPASAWAFRQLVAADLPAGTGTVTSVALSTSGSSALLTISISGSPVTTSGTLTAAINFANQNANLFLAGPSSGGSSAVSARQIVAADLCGVFAVAAATSMTFNAALAAFPVFTVALNTNVTSSAVSNPTSGQRIVFEFTQTGGFTFTFPSNFHGYSTVAPDAGSVTVQEFEYDGSFWRALNPGIVTAS